ncbi:MAG: prepilin-type N-terminal cleavage/methylation domain-containing protein [Candidatus Omnitrophota bacterium]
MRREAGFTLVELLVVVSLMALIGMSVYAMFGSAMDMMRRVSRSEITEDVDIFLERFDREISSQVIFKGIPFNGKETFLSFPSRIGLDKRAPLNRGIGRVSYFFDESDRTFARGQENLNQIYKPEEEVGPTAVLEGVSALKFQYFVYRKAEKMFEWVPDWDSLENGGEIPSAVKVAFSGVQREEPYVFERTVAIPIAEITG